MTQDDSSDLGGCLLRPLLRRFRVVLCVFSRGGVLCIDEISSR